MTRSTFFLWLVWALPSLAAAPFRFTVLHTSDLHSHVEGTGPDGAFTARAGDGDPVLGHYARLATLIREERARAEARGEPVLLVDAGDFFSGSLFHALGPSADFPSFPEAELFQRMGYDAVTLGNHELDAGETGLVTLLTKMFRMGLADRLVVSNLTVTGGDAALAAALARVPRGLVRELAYRGRKLRVGLIGLMGADAARVSAGNRKHLRVDGFDDAGARAKPAALAEAARGAAAILRRNEGAEIVIAVLHGGDPDEATVAAVPGIDLVVAGHTHQLYETPKATKGAWIAQAGSFGRYVGRLPWELDGNRLALRDEGATFLRVDDTIPADAFWLTRIAALKDELTPVLRGLGYAYDTPVVTLTSPLRREPEGNLGRLVTSRLRDELDRRLGLPFDVYFTSLALIREELVPPKQGPASFQFSDIFRMLGIGFDESLRPGSPVVVFHVTKRDFRRVIDLVEAYRLVSPNFATAFSDTVSYHVRPWGVPFVNRVTGVTLRGKPYDEWPALVRVATNSYVAAFLDKVPSMTYGLMRITARDATGAPLAAPPKAGVPPEAVLFADSLRRQPPR